jgi:hypothetical protein
MQTLTPEIVPQSEAVALESMERADTPAIWAGYRKQFEDLKSSVEAVLTADPAAPTSAKIARTNRLALKQIRVAVENKRKELGDYHLRKTQAINAAAKEIKELIEPYEEKLEAIEDHAKRVEEERLRKLAADRTEALSKYTTVSAAVNYSALSEDEFSKMLDDAKTLYDLKQAEAKRIEEERIAHEKAEAEERERIRLENERLKKEAEEKEKALAAERAKLEAERKASEEKARQEREEAERKAAAEAARLREIAEKERKEKEALEAKIAAEKKAEADRIAAEEKARQEAALAPDREKLAAFAAAIRALPVPAITSKKGREIIAAKIEELALWVESASKNLRAK